MSGKTRTANSRPGDRKSSEDSTYQTPIKRPKPVIDHSLKIAAPVSQPGGTEFVYFAPIVELERPPRSGRNVSPLGKNADQRDVEFDSLRDRITQMERTMRWWSDCTDSWRGKLSTMTLERDKLRDENRALRERLAERAADGPGAGFRAPGKRSSKSPTGETPAKPMDFDLQSLLRDLADVTIIEPTKNATTQTDGVGGNALSGQTSRNVKMRPKSQIFDGEMMDSCELSALKLELQEEKNGKAILELKIAELRRKVETWQQQVSKAEDKEQAATLERVKNEQEIQTLNKRCEDLRTQLGDLLRAKRLNLLFQNSYSRDLSGTKETEELKVENNRLRKSMQDQMTELGHMIRRIEHYEADTAQLRTKVNLLQQEIIAAHKISAEQEKQTEQLRLLNATLREQIEQQPAQITHLQIAKTAKQ